MEGGCPLPSAHLGLCPTCTLFRLLPAYLIPTSPCPYYLPSPCPLVGDTCLPGPARDTPVAPTPVPHTPACHCLGTCLPVYLPLCLTFASPCAYPLVPLLWVYTCVPCLALLPCVLFSIPTQVTCAAPAYTHPDLLPPHAFPPLHATCHLCLPTHNFHSCAIPLFLVACSSCHPQASCLPACHCPSHTPPACLPTFPFSTSIGIY